jgi:hypothetical protein
VNVSIRKVPRGGRFKLPGGEVVWVMQSEPALRPTALAYCVISAVKRQMRTFSADRLVVRLGGNDG